MDGKASANDKVTFDYFVTVCIKDEESDCTTVLREYTNDGYKYVTKIKDGENVLIIYKKPKDNTPTLK